LAIASAIGERTEFWLHANSTLGGSDTLMP
jgi:hypothetical protein